MFFLLLTLSNGDYKDIITFFYQENRSLLFSEKEEVINLKILYNVICISLINIKQTLFPLMFK